MPAFVGTGSELKEFLGLRQLPAPQFLDGEGRQGDGSSLTALGFLLTNSPLVGLLCAGDDGELTIVQINGLPPEGVISPRRRPQSVASIIGINRRLSRAVSNTFAVVGASIVRTDFRSIFGRSRLSRRAAIRADFE